MSHGTQRTWFKVNPLIQETLDTCSGQQGSVNITVRSYAPKGSHSAHDNLEESLLSDGICSYKHTRQLSTHPQSQAE
eukprot:2357977-Amphidinium_carterae.1